jgi:hypothetical protein
MDPWEEADNGPVEHRNDERHNTCCQGSSRSVGKVLVDALAILAGQNASTSVVAPAIACQDASWTFPDVPLVHFHPSLPSCVCERHLAGGVGWNVG